MRVSACIIAKNEEKNIAKCIQSCKLIAGSVVLIDTGSADNTVKIAEENGAGIYFLPWNNDFAAAKNFAIDKVQGDWIFFPDADEYIDQETADLLLEQMEQFVNDDNVDAITGTLYNIDTKTEIVTKGSTVTRIFKKSDDIFYSGQIHEKLIHKNRPMNQIVLDKVKVFHTGYSAHLMPEKYERNLKLLYQVEKMGQADGTNYYHIAGTLLALNRFEEAMEYVEKAEKHGDFDFLLKHFSLMYNFFAIKLLCMMNMKKIYSYNDMLKAIDQGITLFPERYELVEQKINLMLEYTKYDEALEQYKEAIRLYTIAQEKSGFSHHKDRSRMLASIGWIYGKNGDTEQAFDYYLKAVVEDYTSEAAIVGLLEQMKDQPTEEIVNFLNQIYDETSQEQVGFLTFITSRSIMPKLFDYYFSRLAADESDRYKKHLLYKELFDGEYDKVLAGAEQMLRLEKNPKKIEELNTLTGVAETLKNGGNE